MVEQGRIRVSLSTIDRCCKNLYEDLAGGPERYRVARARLACGAQVLDAGVETAGSFETGAKVSELCQGGLARASIGVAECGGTPFPAIAVESFAPALSTFKLQSAFGFEGVMLSGPIKLHLEENPFIDRDIPLQDAKNTLSAVVQADELPDCAWARRLAERVKCNAEDLRLVVAPQESVAGSTQISGRMNENILLTMEKSLGYPAAAVEQIVGRSPICPVNSGAKGKKRLLPDDFLHYAGCAYLTMRAEPGWDVKKLAYDLTFESLDIYGALFIDLLEAAGGDFFKIPNIGGINKLAVVTVNDLNSRRVYAAGRANYDLLLSNLI
ncbi:MAG: methenyltetrahydromethanopterin cyclohydrolase [Bacillota bacterium]